MNVTLQGCTGMFHTHYHWTSDEANTSQC
jgi:hypothetical protein